MPASRTRGYRKSIRRTSKYGYRKRRRSSYYGSRKRVQGLAIRTARRSIASGSATRKPWRNAGFKVPYPKSEIKHLQTTGNNAVSTTMQVADLCYQITQGSGVSNRIGNEILIKNVQVRGHVTASTTTVLQHCRLVLIYDKQPNGAYPAFTDIYLAASCDSLPRLDIANRFIIFKEWYFPIEGYVTASITGGGISSSYLIDENIPVNCPIKYGANAGAVADLRSGNLFFMQIGDVAAAATNPYATISLQVDYFDT